MGKLAPEDRPSSWGKRRLRDAPADRGHARRAQHRDEGRRPQATHSEARGPSTLRCRASSAIIGHQHLIQLIIVEARGHLLRHRLTPSSPGPMVDTLLLQLSPRLNAPHGAPEPARPRVPSTWYRQHPPAASPHARGLNAHGRVPTYCGAPRRSGVQILTHGESPKPPSTCSARAPSIVPTRPTPANLPQFNQSEGPGRRRGPSPLATS